ncbi:MAG: hypothetical protein QF864_09340 [SAR202 cluster bacterium]|nr:hypothetical protein [SAR202 cluster bacterium]
MNVLLGIDIGINKDTTGQLYGMIQINHVFLILEFIAITITICVKS